MKSKEKEIDRITGQYTQDPVTRKIERIAAYVRVSTTEQKLHGLSLDAQKAKIAQYAKDNHMKIVEWYIDDGVSGRKLIRNRPDLQRMIHDAEKGKFDRIVFIKLDRFFRSVAEYHECMKRIAPVVWTTTDEEYDLTTANGRMLVNMKLTIAEMEADMAGERVDAVNDYKMNTGQPLTGSMPFGFKIVIDPANGRKKIIRDPDTEPIVRDILDHYLTHQSRHRTLLYAHAKYHIGMSYDTLKRLLKNTFLYGAFRDNPAYCEAYINKETFDRIQDISRRNVKDNTAENRAYWFSGLLKCPLCGTTLKGGTNVCKRNGKVYVYKLYRCQKNRSNNACTFGKAISESKFEKMMLANIEKYLDDAKIRAAKVSESSSVKIPKYSVDDINGEIDRLNYSWQTGKIRKVEQYEAQYAELIAKLEMAEAEQGTAPEKDFGEIEAILHDGWRTVYKKLDDEHKRSFWRSFIRAIYIDWTTDKKEITRVDFF